MEKLTKLSITYQLGNMISSPSAQIVNAIAETTFVRDAGGPHVEAYGPVMGVATAIIAVGIAVTVAIGPEKKGRRFEEALPAGVAEIPSPKDVEMGDAEEHEDEKKTVACSENVAEKRV